MPDQPPLTFNCDKHDWRKPVIYAVMRRQDIGPAKPIGYAWELAEAVELATADQDEHGRPVHIKTESLNAQNATYLTYQ